MCLRVLVSAFLPSKELALVQIRAVMYFFQKADIGNERVGPMLVFAHKVHTNDERVYTTIEQNHRQHIPSR